ncbi:MAG: hypothetical protein WAL50_16195 [Kineosporiaceae bacterium]
MSSPPDPATMMATLVDPVRLQVFAAMVTVTGPGRREPFPPAPNTRSVSYLTPTGAANLTGVSVDDAYAAFRALQKAGLAIPASTNPRRNGWRLDADNLAIAAGQHPTSWTRDSAGRPV